MESKLPANGGWWTRAISAINERAIPWRPAMKWGIGVAVAHRLILTVWMAGVWLSLGVSGMGVPHGTHEDATSDLPALHTPAEQALLDVWRRWDAVHYLDLAKNGYRAIDPKPSLFGPLVPLGIRLADIVLPGPVDIGGIAFGTAAFALALIVVFRVCEVAYSSQGLARRTVILAALLPLSYYYAAPMSEALYLALAAATFYAGWHKRWALAAAIGFFATLARSQGVVLAVVVGLMVIQSVWESTPGWGERIKLIIAQGWPLIAIPLAQVLFVLYRDWAGLPPLLDVYAIYHVRFVNPVEGLLLNLSWFVTQPLAAVRNVHIMVLVACLGLVAAAARVRLHKQMALIVFSAAHILVFVTKVDAISEPVSEFFTHSFARYALALFPLIALLADGFVRLPRWGRPVIVALLAGGLLLLSAVFALGYGPH